MVGLGAIAEFTHGIEAVLERIRGGTLAVDSDIITTLLEARDHLAMMIEAEAVKSPIPASGELSQRLLALLRGPGAAGSRREETALADRAPAAQAAEAKPKRKRPPRKTKKMAAAESAASSESKQVPSEGELTVYQITLMPGPDVLRRGVNPLGVLDELRELGETTITTDPDLVPPLEQLDPERCYLTWTIQVKTASTPERLSEAFLFFSEDSALSISRLTSDGKLVPVPLSAPAIEEALSTPPIGFEKPAKSPAAVAPTGTPTPEVSPPPPQPAVASPAREATSAPAPGSTPVQAPLAAPSPSLPRLHARIRVDAGQLDDLVGLAGELVVVTDNLLGLRELPGVERWTHAPRGTRAGEPGGQGHDAGPANGPCRRAFFEVSARGPGPGRPLG